MAPGIRLCRNRARRPRPFGSLYKFYAPVCREIATEWNSRCHDRVVASPKLGYASGGLYGKDSAALSSRRDHLRDRRTGPRPATARVVALQFELIESATLSSWPGLTRPSASLRHPIKEDVDARQRRQVYAVCASLTALPGMTTHHRRFRITPPRCVRRCPGRSGARCNRSPSA
jgi:hypothetical protein